jgi:aryl-alcohol dehydrogenase-like predicted oxidoreductase
VKRRALGSTGPELTAVGFGAWAIGGPWKFGWGKVVDDDSIAALRRAVERGVNWVDTAAVYGHGHSEEVVGQALEPYAVGEDVHVFTKCGRRWDDAGEIRSDLRPASIREECDQSLRRLRVDRIDLYQAHWPDWETGTPLEESWGAMVELADEGKVRWLGLCNHSVEQLAVCEAIRHVDAVQPPLSLLARGARRTVIPWAAEHGSGVIVYSPLASGLLSGGFTRERVARIPEDDWRRLSALYQEPAVTRNLELVESLAAIAAQLGTSLPALAVAWAVAQRGVTGAIVGARLPRHVEGWVPAADLTLDAETLAAIDAAIAESGAGSDEPPAPPAHLSLPTVGSVQKE